MNNKQSTSRHTLNFWRLHSLTNETFHLMDMHADALVSDPHNVSYGLDRRLVGREDMALLFTSAVNSVTLFEQERRASFTDMVKSYCVIHSFATC